MNREWIDMYLRKVQLSFTEVNLPAGEKLKIGVDLGTAYIVIVVLDEDNRPVTGACKRADVLRDGIVVDYFGAIQIVKQLKKEIESKLGRELYECAIAMPSGTESSTKTHQYVVESAGFEVIAVLDEAVAANAVLQIKDGAVVDIGGGTTGIAVFRDGKVLSTADEVTGGHHLSLVLSGHYHISLEEAETMKHEEINHSKIYPVVKPVIEKMAAIVEKNLRKETVDQIALCGGSCCLTGIEQVFQAQLPGKEIWKPEKPLLVTPVGIALNCG